MSNPFNFGQPAATSGSSGGGLFGTAPGASPFGKNPTTTVGAGNSSSGATVGGLFGATPTGSAPGNLFGGTAFSFGNPAAKTPNPPTPASSTAPTGGISGASTGPGSAASIFGSTTPSGNKTAPFSFGNPSTTPAGPPPDKSAFGASTGGGANLQPASSGASIFGNPASAGGGGGFSPFGQPKQHAPALSAPPGNNAEAPKPAFSFGNTPSSNPPTQKISGAPSQPPGSIFSSLGGPSAEKGTPKAPAFSFPAAPASSNAGASPSLFGGAPTSSAEAPKSGLSSFGGAATTTTTEPSKPGFSFPAQPTTSAEALKSGLPGSSAPPATSAEGANPLFSFPSTMANSSSSGTQASKAPTVSGPTLAPFGGFGAPKTSTPGSTAPAAPAGLSASTAGPVPPVQSRLKNKTMDEILTRWASDLTKYTKEFRTHAETVAHWDQMVVENMAKITKLYSTTFISEKQTDSVDMQLSAVESQQNELEALLSNYESVVDEMLAKNGPTQVEMGGPDQERERTYKLAEKLGERLDDMGRDLESMIEEINAANSSLSKNTKADEPITQIVRILNSHLTQLQAIDQGTVALQAKVAAAQKSAATLGYLNGGGNGVGEAAVHDFYRSYMGRR